MRGLRQPRIGVRAPWLRRRPGGREQKSLSCRFLAFNHCGKLNATALGCHLVSAGALLAVWQDSPQKGTPNRASAFSSTSPPKNFVCMPKKSLATQLGEKRTSQIVTASGKFEVNAFPVLNGLATFIVKTLTCAFAFLPLLGGEDEISRCRARLHCRPLRH